MSKIILLIGWTCLVAWYAYELGWTNGNIAGVEWAREKVFDGR